MSEVRPITDNEAIAEAPCPHCRAEAGEPCVVAGDRNRQTFPGAHSSRRMNAIIFKDIRAKRARQREAEAVVEK